MDVGVLFVDKLPVTETTPAKFTRYTMDGTEYIFPLSRDWKPFDERDDFRRDGVVGITLTDDRGVRSGLIDRLWNRLNRFDAVEKWHGGDTYAIGVWGKYFFCDQWDDMEDHLHIRSIDDPQAKIPGVGKQMNLPRPDRHPTDSVVTTFRGGWMPVPEWEKAIVIFDKEIF